MRYYYLTADFTDKEVDFIIHIAKYKAEKNYDRASLWKSFVACYEEGGSIERIAMPEKDMIEELDHMVGFLHRIGFEEFEDYGVELRGKIRNNIGYTEHEVEQ